MSVSAYGVRAGNHRLEPLQIERRTPGANDVQIDIAYCGVGDLDLIHARSTRPGTRFPCVPGNEIVGRVSAVGKRVTRFQPEDLVGVGNLVDSCRQCEQCDDGLECHCKGVIGTCNFPITDAPGHTLGGYSQRIVVHERFVLKVSHAESELPAVAPLLGDGLAMYLPLRQWRVGLGTKVGIVGAGGLASIGARMARSMGAQVVALTIGEAERRLAKCLGAHEVVRVKDASKSAVQAGSFDLILNTIADPHELDEVMTLLRRGGTMTMVGSPLAARSAPSMGAVTSKRRSIVGRLSGGIRETQDMLKLCAQHHIVSEIEVIRANQIDECYDLMTRGSPRYRYVVDNATLDTM